MRFTILAALTAVLILVPTPSHTVANDKDPIKIDEKTQKAVDKALEWMKARQNRDGSWGNTAITSFAILAYMSNGHVPNQGVYGNEVSKAVRYILSASRDDGYLVHPSSGGNMYCHGMATLALTQVWGMTGDEEVRKVLRRAVNLIVKTQNREGGWRYEPAPTGADISVTIMMVMALRGAKDSGLHVPNETLENALDYIEKCRDVRSGGYRYQPRSSGPGYARTAAGICVLQLCGEYDSEHIDEAVKYLEKTQDDRTHYWYGHYYAAHAYHQLGDKRWHNYYDRMKTKLLSAQRQSGEWYERMEQHVGPVYQTSIAVLILSVPTHFLPIYQR